MKFQLPAGTGMALATVAVVLAFVLSWKLFDNINPYESLMPGDEMTSAAPMTLSGVALQGRDNGFPSWHIAASTMVISPNREDASAYGLSNGVFYANNHPALHISADMLHYAIQPFSLKSQFNVSGHVNAWTDGSFSLMPLAMRIKTSAVIWDGAASVGSCPGPVMFSIRGVANGAANGLTINQATNMVHFGSATASLLNADSAFPTARTVAETSQPAARSADDADTVTWSALDGGYWDENNRVLTLPGPVSFRQGEAQVSMVGAVYDRKTDTATSDSPITITDTDTKVVGNKGIVDFATHIAIVKGDVVMTVIPKETDQVKSDEEEAKKPTTILCDQVNYDYREKIAHTAGKVVVKQTDRTITADDGQYNVSSKIVDLVGNVVGSSTDGKIIKAPKAEVSVDQNDEWIQVTGPISGQFTVASQDNPLDTSKKKASTGSIKPLIQSNTPTVPEPKSSSSSAQ